MTEQPTTTAPAPGGGGSTARATFVARQRGRKAQLYLVRVTGGPIVFYAAGVTYSISNLFGRLKRKTYQVQVLAQFSSADAGAAWDLGQELQSTFWRSLGYWPQPVFVAGHCQCYRESAPLLAWLEATNLPRTQAGLGRAAWVAKQNDRKAVLYVVKLSNPEECFYKVGATFDLSRRLTQLSAAYKRRVVAQYSSYNAGKVWDLEQKIHATLSYLRYVPQEEFSGFTECYRSAEEILAMLPKQVHG